MDIEPYDLYWSQVRDLYSPFESGMKSGTARVFEHQIPGGQYSNLLVQCKSMGLQGEQWDRVLNAYRDVNELFGDVVKVTPSSKCVGDLALYLVVQNLTTADLLNPAKAGTIDFPESVVGLLKGDLGFPHRGFPKVSTICIVCICVLYGTIWYYMVLYGTIFQNYLHTRNPYPYTPYTSLHPLHPQAIEDLVLKNGSIPVRQVRYHNYLV